MYFDETFGWVVAWSKKWLDFGGDPDHNLDPEIF